ncbi:MAG: Maf family protein [Lachnospiraceae bacterium]|nr:Maf family protein [Lachnospiraceae bacterium]
MRFVLASKSPRRKEILSLVGMKFECMESTEEERADRSLLPGEYVMKLASDKAENVEGNCGFDGDRLIIGADTVVVCDGRILGKPADGREAFTMLSSLSGRSHSVYTGVAVRGYKDGVRISRTFFEETRVEFYPMSDEDINRYIATGDPLDKAGAYGIQGVCCAHIKGIEGDYLNVVGLPVSRLCMELNKLNIDWRN